MPQLRPFLDVAPDVAVSAVVRTAETSTAEHQAAIWILTYPGLPLARVWRIQKVRTYDLVPGIHELAASVGGHLAGLARNAWSTTEQQLLDAAHHLYTGTGAVRLRGLNEHQLARVHTAARLANGLERWHSGFTGNLVHDLATIEFAHTAAVS